MENKHGGKRQNSGAKLKYGEPTKNISFKVPESKINEVRKLVYDYLKQFDIYLKI